MGDAVTLRCQAEFFSLAAQVLAQRAIELNMPQAL